MMLVQKPQSAMLSPTGPYTHRRHPSAPVLVQPTRTPGLLTLTKPIRPPPQRLAPPQYRREPKTTPRAPKQASAVVRAQTLTPAAEIKSLVPATSSPQPRGRTQVKHGREKIQINRSASHSSLRGKHGRQPSPPIAAQQPAQQSQSQLQQTPSQAEATVVPPIKSSNLFDPFLDNSISPPPSPTLASKPTGKLARRRQQQSPLPALSKAIPVPNAQRSKSSHVSHSEPLPSHMRQVPKRSSTYQDFPICDDMTEVADRYASPPSTPRRPTTNFSGPNTAPLSAHASGFPFMNMELSTPLANAGKRDSRRHRRVPSEGVFNMSSDEDVSTGPGGVVLNANVQALFGVMGKRTSLPASPFTTPVAARAATAAPPRSRESSPSYGSLSREKQLEREAYEKAGYFASSMFQNSPSPEELPDPLLL